VQLLSRLNLRHNWPLLVALLIFGLSVGLIGTQFASIKVLDAPKYGETISYWARVTDPFVYNLKKNFWFIWPIIALLSLLIFAVQRLPNYSSGQALGCLLILFANLFSCVIFGMSFVQPDGHTLIHVQSVSRLDHVYHLTLDHVQGGGADYFYSIYFVFKCDLEGNQCQIIKSTTNVYDFGGNPPPAHLVVDSATNTLYLQIGDQKTLVAQ
jgi:hypothetical protein